MVKIRFDPWVRKIAGMRARQPTLVLLPGESHGRRSLVGYSPWGPKESDTTERLHFFFFPVCVLGLCVTYPYIIFSIMIFMSLFFIYFKVDLEDESF